MDIKCLHQSSRVEIRAFSRRDSSDQSTPMELAPTRTHIYLMVDGVQIEEASGKTLGEAFLHLGGLMLGETLLPMSVLTGALK